MSKPQAQKPLIRFPEFNDTWHYKKLSELLSESKERNTDLKYGKNEVLSVSGELGIVNQIEHLGRSYAGVSVHQYHVVEVGNIVYTKSPLKANPFGIIKLNKNKAGIVSTLYAVYKVNQQTAFGPWIDYYFSLDANTNRYLRPLVKKGAKNDMKISNEYVLHDRIFVPTIPEQKRIASFFTVIDKKIAELKQKKNLWEQYKKGVMQKLFSLELRFKDENGKMFPKWEKKQIGDLGEIITGSTPPTSNKAYYNGNYLFVSPGDIQVNRFVTQTQKTLTESGFLKGRKVRKGSSLFVCIGGTIGKLAQAGMDCVSNQQINSVIPINNNDDFVFFLLQHYSKKIASLAAEQAVPIINKTNFSSFELKVPNKTEQYKIATFLNEIDNKIMRIENQILQTQQYRKGLLQKMFI
jgi:type I restriction enzyme, S subunit